MPPFICIAYLSTAWTPPTLDQLTSLLESARTLAPNHRVFVQERKRAEAAQAAAPVGLMDQFRQLLNRFQKRG